MESVRKCMFHVSYLEKSDNIHKNGKEGSERIFSLSNNFNIPNRRRLRCRGVEKRDRRFRSW